MSLGRDIHLGEFAISVERERRDRMIVSLDVHSLASGYIQRKHAMNRVSIGLLRKAIYCTTTQCLGSLGQEFPVGTVRLPYSGMESV